MEIKRYYLNFDKKLVNHVKLYNDPIHGLRLIAGGNDKTIMIFDVNGDSEPVETINVGYFVNHFTLDQKHDRIILAYDDTDVEVYSFKSGEKQGTLKGHLDFSFGSDFHPDGYTAVTCNQDLTSRIWDLRKWEET